MADKKPTLTKVTSSSNVINDFQKFNWEKDVNRGRITNNEIEKTKHLYRKKYIAISAIIIGVLFVISACTIGYLWYIWGDDHTINEKVTDEQISKTFDDVKTKYDEMKSNNWDAFNNDDNDNLSLRLNKLTFFKANYLTNRPNDFYNNFSRKYSTKYTNLIKEIDEEVTEAKTTLKNNISSSINSITYDTSMFNSKDEVKTDTKTLSSSIYSEQLSDLMSTLTELTTYQALYSVFSTDEFSNLQTVCNDKSDHIKKLFIAAVKQETENQSSESIKKDYENEYNEKLKTMQDDCNKKIQEKEDEITKLKEENEKLTKSSSDNTSSNSTSSNNNTSTDTSNNSGQQWIRIN